MKFAPSIVVKELGLAQVVAATRAAEQQAYPFLAVPGVCPPLEPRLRQKLVPQAMAPRVEPLLAPSDLASKPVLGPTTRPQG